MQADCIILGGGAAGLAAACALSGSGLRIALVEQQDRVGKKLLATGNGRCNLSNADMAPERYGEAAPFVRRVYEATPPSEVLAFFDRLGLMLCEEEGRLYPRTRMAASVLDVLRAGCGDAAMLTGREAVSLAPSRRGGLCVQLADGEALFAPAVLAALGGSAAPHLGTDGSGTRLLEALGHTVTPLFPALVQLKCAHPALRSLKGLRVQTALTLEIDGASAAREAGELLFADYGVSGVCVFQLSGLAARALSRGSTVRLLINLLPELPEDELSAWLDRRIGLHPDVPAQALFVGVLPRLLAQAVLRQAGVGAETPASTLSFRERLSLLGALSVFPMEVTGTQGMKQAQVTAGGVALSEVDPSTMRSRCFDSLYLAGELLDVDGPCGGYNLHFAFASALTAAKAIRAQLSL